jgi:hypothetical protein
MHSASLTTTRLALRTRADACAAAAAAAVWGSWWHDGTWGYACCHQTVKNSYCTGAAGKAGAAAAGAQMLANMEAKAAEDAALLAKCVLRC